MSAFSGPQGKGAAKSRRAKMRAEAEIAALAQGDTAQTGGE